MKVLIGSVALLACALGSVAVAAEKESDGLAVAACTAAFTKNAGADAAVGRIDMPKIVRKSRFMRFTLRADVTQGGTTTKKTAQCDATRTGEVLAFDWKG